MQLIDRHSILIVSKQIEPKLKRWLRCSTFHNPRKILGIEIGFERKSSIILEQGIFSSLDALPTPLWFEHCMSLYDAAYIQTVIETSCWDLRLYVQGWYYPIIDKILNGPLPCTEHVENWTLRLPIISWPSHKLHTIDASLWQMYSVNSTAQGLQCKLHTATGTLFKWLNLSFSQIERR